MILNLDGVEIEVHRDSFVCIDDGRNSHFCEWKYLNPVLQDTFEALTAELEAVVERFVTSENRAAFDGVAEKYEDTPCPCSNAAV